MSLVFDWGDSSSLNQAEINGKIRLVGVEDLIKVLYFTFFTLISPRFDVAKDGCVLCIGPVRELVVTKDVVGTVGGVVVIDDPVPINESL